MKNKYAVLVVSTILILPAIIIDLFIVDEIDYINYFADKVPAELMEQLIEERLRWKWLGYFFGILAMLLKTVIIASLIWLGTFLYESKQSFSKILNISLWAQLVFSLKGYLLLITAIVQKDFNLEKIQSFSPLSLATLFENNKLEQYQLFIFKSLNLFELSYWFVLGYLLSRILKTNFNEGLKITLSTYVPAFGLWLLAVTFFLVSNS